MGNTRQYRASRAQTGLYMGVLGVVLEVVLVVLEVFLVVLEVVLVVLLDRMVRALSS